MEIELNKVESITTNEDDIQVLVAEAEDEKQFFQKYTFWTFKDVDANSKAMEFHFNVQWFKVLTYVAFLFMNIVAIICTYAGKGGIPEPNIIKTVFGANMICLFYDYPPATYVLPPLWAICVVFSTFYAVTSIYRARLAQAENQITYAHMVFFNINSTGFAIAMAIFSICLAVQPDVDEIPTVEDFHILKIHTYPFTNLIIWLILDQISIVWFGWLAGWTGVDDNGEPNFPQCFKIISVVHVVLQGLQAFIHMFYQFNGLLGEYGEGLWVSPKNPAWQAFGSASGALFLILSFFTPLILGIYEITREGRHLLIFTIKDNKNGKKDA